MNLFFRNICKVSLLLLFCNNGFSQSAYIDSLRQVIATSPKVDSSKLETLKELADEYYEYDFDSTIHYYQTCLDISQELPHYAIGFSTLRSFAYTYSFRKNNYVKAIEYFDRARQLAETKNDSIGVAETYNDMGTVFWKRGQSAKAMEYYLKVKKIGEELQDDETLLRSNLSIGIIHNEEGDNVKALLHYREALVQADSLGYTVATGLLLNNMGIAYQDDAKYDEALEHFEQAEKIFLEIERNGRLALATSNIGKNYVLQGDFSKGLTYYKRALDYNSKVEDNEQRAEIYLGIATAMSKMENHAQSIVNAEKGIDLLADVETDLYYTELYKIIADGYKKQGAYKKSLEAYELHLAAKEKIDSEETTQKIEELQVLYEQQKNETKIQKLSLEQEKNARELDQSQNFVKLLLAMVVILIIGGILFFTYNNVRQLKAFDTLKTKLSKDLHDNIGASLNHIKMLSTKLTRKKSAKGSIGENDSELKEELQKIKKISNELMFDLYDMLWSLDKEKSNLGDLTERMQDQIDNTIRLEGFKIRCDFEKLNPEITLPMEVKTNVYAIFKEAIHNILKHTPASDVSIIMKEEKKNHLSLTIRNTFENKISDPQFSSKKGLKNMQKRADELNGNLKIDEQSNSFTVYLDWKI